MSDDEGKLPLPDLESGAARCRRRTARSRPSPTAPDHSAADLEAVFDVPVKVSAVLGRARMEVGELLKLGPGAVLELDRKVGEAIDIYVNNRLVARGEVVLVEDKLGVTMTEIIKADNASDSEGIARARRNIHAPPDRRNPEGPAHHRDQDRDGQGRQRHPRRDASSRRSPCCAPAAAPTC